MKLMACEEASNSVVHSLLVVLRRAGCCLWTDTLYPRYALQFVKKAGVWVLE